MPQIDGNYSISLQSGASINANNPTLVFRGEEEDHHRLCDPHLSHFSYPSQRRRLRMRLAHYPPARTKTEQRYSDSATHGITGLYGVWLNRKRLLERVPLLPYQSRSNRSVAGGGGKKLTKLSSAQK